MRLLFSEIYKRYLYRARIVAHSKHVSHYGPQATFPYYILTQSPPNRESSPLSATQERATQNEDMQNKIKTQM